MRLQPLPSDAEELLIRLHVPERLSRHLALTHDAAICLLAGFCRCWPALVVDRESVLFGAATHDIGKVLCVEELSGSGNQHEAVGEKLLLSLGVPSERARFCRTHGSWDHRSPLEDLLVALADTVWKGKRNERLETLIIDRIVFITHEETWKVYSELDDLLVEIGHQAEVRLAWQGS